MTDYTKLSDSELNEIVAKVLGWESYNGDSWKQRRISGCYLYDALPNYLDPANLHRLMDDARAAGMAPSINLRGMDGYSPVGWIGHASCDKLQQRAYGTHPTSANRALAEAIAQIGDCK